MFTIFYKCNLIFWKAYVSDNQSWVWVPNCPSRININSSADQVKKNDRATIGNRYRWCGYQRLYQQFTLLRQFLLMIQTEELVPILEIDLTTTASLKVGRRRRHQFGWLGLRGEDDGVLCLEYWGYIWQGGYWRRVQYTWSTRGMREG